MGKKRKTPAERWAYFLSKVEVQDDGCWIWQGGIGSHGYGRCFDGDRIVLAHRWAWEQHNGKLVPDGLQIDHFFCSRKLCVNPEHLRPVTQWENILRSGSFSAKRKGRTHCERGHEYTPESTMHKANGTRECRICRNVGRRARYYATKSSV